MRFHIVTIDTDATNEPPAQLLEAAAKFADQVHAAVDALTDLPADATTAAVLAAYAQWTHTQISGAEGQLLLQLYENGVPCQALGDIAGTSADKVAARITWQQAVRDGVIHTHYEWDKDWEQS